VSFFGQVRHDLLWRELPIFWRVGDGQDGLSLCQRQFVPRYGQGTTATIAAILLLGPPLEGAGGQTQHSGRRLHSGAQAHGFIDQFESLLPR